MCGNRCEVGAVARTFNSNQSIVTEPGVVALGMRKILLGRIEGSGAVEALGQVCCGLGLWKDEKAVAL